MKNKIPQLLIFFRLILGPIMILLTHKFGTLIRFELVFLILLGLISDIFDGIIARKLEISSENLRRLDSQVDVVFWLCVGICAWILHPEIIYEFRYFIVIVFLMEALTYVFSFIKFRKETCTHALLSKLWGLSLCVVFLSIIGFGYGGIAVCSCGILGIIGHLDVYLIIYFLPKWQHDIPSCYHAFLIKKGIPIKRNKLFNG